jgi:predicted HicB family RNase H-like nuclease
MTDAASRSHNARQPRATTAADARASGNDRGFEAHRVAQELYRQKPEWMMFFREILGVGGVLARLFPTREERAEFEKSPEYAEIQRMLAELRRKRDAGEEDNDREPTRMITVRLPKSMHESLRAEAYQRQISINKLCIAKLLKTLDDEEQTQNEKK